MSSPLRLLPAVVAGLLVFELVSLLTPWLRLRALGRDGPRLLAVTLIAAPIFYAYFKEELHDKGLV